MAKLDLQKLLTKKGWKLSDLARASGISQTVLRMIQDSVFAPTGHEARLIGEALARPYEPKPTGKKKPPESEPIAAPATPPPGPAGQLDLFFGGGPP